ncbi:MAG TPA: biphenyl-2,3-diol 1,2-dioxygenase [Candidatus Binataceae bacterium]|jgi:2,3-dihydroxybiphenyl 1,2-dioxygenase|nr:biphenyl-2,3-diol 1,2-dioxygenase [Candidatus Binataceae bacterium]
MASVTQLGYLGIGVSELARWEHFASEVLGLQVNGTDSDGSMFLRMDEYHHRFILLPGGPDDVAFVGWEVRDQPALDEIRRRLSAGGVEVAEATPEETRARRVVGLIKLRDPSGVPTEIYFGPLMNFEQPFKSPRAISGFVTGEQGMGHIVVRVDDAARSLHFYRDLLGMRISDFIDMRSHRSGQSLSLTFMHCNPRHHSIAFGVIPARKRLMHFMLQTRSVDDVGSTYYLCQDRGIEISGTLGRHTNDHMMSFYLRSPSGFEVEYGWGARVVDDATWQVQKHEAPSIWGHRGSLAPMPTKQAPV